MFVSIMFLFTGRKSGKGCYVYSGKKNKSVNTEAEALLEKYRIPINGRYLIIHILTSSLYMYIKYIYIYIMYVYNAMRTK